MVAEVAEESQEIMGNQGPDSGTARGFIKVRTVAGLVDRHL